MRRTGYVAGRWLVFLLGLLTVTVAGEEIELVTLAGSTKGPGLIDGPANVSRFSSPEGITVAEDGSIFVADAGNHVIRRIDGTTGVVTTYAGVGRERGFADGDAGDARFAYPSGVCVGPGGVVAVADRGNGRLRLISAEGQVSTIVEGLEQPWDVACDPDGSYVVTDRDAGRILRVRDGVLSDVAFATSPTGVTIDKDGRVLFVDMNGSFILTVSPTGQVGSVAPGPFFPSVTDVTVDDEGRVYVVDSRNQVVGRVDRPGETTVIGGVLTLPGYRNGPVEESRFSFPLGVAVTPDGGVVVTELDNPTIRLIQDGIVSTIGGQVPDIGTADGTGVEARFRRPEALAVSRKGNVFVIDVGRTIRRITPAGVVTLLAGSFDESGHVDGAGSVARFGFAEGIAVDAAENVYVTDFRFHTIRQITPAGVVTTWAGKAGVAGDSDGFRTDALFSQPFGITVDDDGNVWVGDVANKALRRIASDGMVTTVATGLATPVGLDSDPQGNIYVLDENLRKVLRFTPDGTRTILARFSRTTAWGGVAVAPDGKVYFADTFRHVIREVGSLAVDSSPVYVGEPDSPGSEDGDRSVARINRPFGFAITDGGEFVIGDTFNAAIRITRKKAPLPDIIVFTADPPRVERGGVVQLRWDVSGANEVRILPAPGLVEAEGEANVVINRPTLFELRARNDEGESATTILIDLRSGRNRPVRTN